MAIVNKLLSTFSPRPFWAYACDAVQDLWACCGHDEIKKRRGVNEDLLWV
jgi:hypothetical protein